ncbi:MAG TPA: YlxR family protein [Chloroflexota bacterium]|nr:YlxR family protein [Chloroflexota bacterium]
MKQRHVPLRTCAGCREQRPKREMVRIVRTREGNVRIDATGKVSGRGAYVCLRQECWAAALRSTSLAHVLKTAISSSDLDELHRFVREGFRLKRGGGTGFSDASAPLPA